MWEGKPASHHHPSPPPADTENRPSINKVGRKSTTQLQCFSFLLFKCITCQWLGMPICRYKAMASLRTAVNIKGAKNTSEDCGRRTVLWSNIKVWKANHFPVTSHTHTSHHTHTHAHKHGQKWSTQQYTHSRIALSLFVRHITNTPSQEAKWTFHLQTERDKTKNMS